VCSDCELKLPHDRGQQLEDIIASVKADDNGKVITTIVLKLCIKQTKPKH